MLVLSLAPSLSPFTKHMWRACSLRDTVLGPGIPDEDEVVLALTGLSGEETRLNQHDLKSPGSQEARA